MISPVIQMMRARRHAASRSDGFKLGLVLPSEGLGGVRTAGMLAALEHFGFGGVFDAVYGSSVGAHNGCYFLSRNTVVSSRGYDIVSTDRNIQRQIFSFRRLLRGQSVFNVDRMYAIMDHENPVDWKAFWNNPTQLKIIATCPETAKPVVLPPFKNKEELILAIRASSFVPVIMAPNLPYHDKLYVDGGFTAPVPWRFALEDGCTHILVIKSWWQGQTIPPPARFLRLIAYLHPEGRARYPKIFQQYQMLHQHALTAERELQEYQQSGNSPHLLATYQAAIGQRLGFFPASDRRLVYNALIANFHVMANLLHENADQLPHELSFEKNPLHAHSSAAPIPAR